jgi:hypothetical protein
MRPKKFFKIPDSELTDDERNWLVSWLASNDRTA